MHKKAARFLVRSGLIPSIDTSKKTRRYTIKTEDVIRYLQERESCPENIVPIQATTLTLGTKATIPEK